MNWILKFLLCFVFLFPVKAYSSVRILPQTTEQKNEDHSFVGVLLNLNGFTGSCFFVGDGEYVITARHMVTENGTISGNVTSLDNIKIIAIQDDQNSDILDVTWMRIHESSDICILKVNKKWKHFISLPNHIQIYNENDIFTGVGFGLDSTTPEVRPTVYDKRNTHRLSFQNRIKEPVQLGFDYIPDVFYFDLSKPSTYNDPSGAVDGEGIIGFGDSGGCAYVNVNGKKVAVGIFSCLIIATTSTDETIEMGMAVDLSSPIILEWLQEYLPKEYFN